MLFNKIKTILLKIPPYYRSYIPFYQYGKTYRKYLKFLREFELYTESEKKDFQKRRIEEILKIARKNKYYYEIIGEKLTFLEFKNIDFLTREIIKNNDLTTEKKIKLKKTFTSGSSGSPLTVYRSSRENEYEEATIHYLLEKCGVNLKGRVRILNLRTNSFDMPYSYGDCVYIPISYIKEENINNIKKIIEKFSPKVIHAHPSVMLTLSSLLDEENMEIIRKNLKVILLSSEVLTEVAKEKIYKIFKSKILDYYSNEENSICGYRIYPDMEYFDFPKFYSYIEVVDNELVCTSLTSEAMPFIRYKTGDYILGGNLEKVKNISGRKSEYLLDKNEIHIPLENFSTYEYPNVELFQFCQLSKGIVEFRVKALPGKKVNCNEIEEILQGINNDIKYEIRLVNSFSKTKNNKHKILIGLIK